MASGVFWLFLIYSSSYSSLFLLFLSYWKYLEQNQIVEKPDLLYCPKYLYPAQWTAGISIEEKCYVKESMDSRLCHWEMRR